MPVFQHGVRQLNNVNIYIHTYRLHAAAIGKSTGCKGTYALMQLPHHNTITQSVPDAMHTIKDVIGHVFNLITGREDSHKVHDAESEINRFASKKKKWDPSTLCYRLLADDIKLANSRLAIVNLPSQDFTPLNLFTSTAGLKSHDWKEVGIPYATIDNFLRGGSL